MSPHVRRVRENRSTIGALTIAEVSDELRISESSVLRLVRSRRLRAISVGERKLIILREDLLKVSSGIRGDCMSGLKAAQPLGLDERQAVLQIHRSSRIIDPMLFSESVINDAWARSLRRQERQPPLECCLSNSPLAGFEPAT